MVHADLSHELLCTIFMPRTELHDGAVIIRGDSVLAAAALLPLTEMTLSERFGTRHRAALGITEDTDAVAVVVSEESGQMSVVERARIVRVPNEAQLERALLGLLEAPNVPGRPRARPAGGVRRPAGPAACASRAGRRPRRSLRRRRPRAGTGPRRRGGRRPPPCRTREHRPRPPGALGRVIVHNWPLKLARRRARHAAVRRARRVPGQQHLPGPDQGHARQPAGRHGDHQPACATSSR